MNTLIGGVSAFDSPTSWGAAAAIPKTATAGTNWSDLLSGTANTAGSLISGLLAGSKTPVYSAGTSFDAPAQTSNPTLPVQTNPVVQNIPAPNGGTTNVNTQYAPVQNNLDYTKIVNPADATPISLTPNRGNQAGAAMPNFQQIQLPQNQALPGATGPTGQPAGTQQIFGADGLIRIGNNTYSPNQVTAQGYGDPQVYQPQQQQYMQPQYMPQQQQYVPSQQGFGPNPYVQQQQQLLNSIPQSVGNSAAYNQALQASQDVLRATSPYVNNPTAYPNMPAMYATQQGWRGRLNHMAAQLNPNLGVQQRYADHNAATIYNAQVREAGEERRHAFGARNTAANNIMTHESQNAREGFSAAIKLADKYLHDPNDPAHKDALIKFMLDKFPEPGEARNAFIRSMYLDKGVSLQQYADLTSPAELQQYRNQVLAGKRDQQLYDYYQGVNADRAAGIRLANQGKQLANQFHAEADPFRIQQIKTNNALAAGRLDIMNATKAAVMALKNTQAQRAQLEYGIRQKYGGDLAEAQITNLRASAAAKEMKQLDSCTAGAKIVVDEFFKLQSQINAAQEPMKSELQSQMNIFGETMAMPPTPTGKLNHDGTPVMISGNVPRQVVGAIKFLKDDSRIARQQLMQAYNKVQALRSAAAAGRELPPLSADGELQAVAGFLK